MFPLAVRSATGALTAGLLGVLLAISPFLVFFSRQARPYAPALLLATTAVFALHAHGERRRRWLGVVFALGAGTAVWFLPPFGPFLLGCWLAAGMRRGALWPGLGAGLCGAALLAPALLVDHATLSAKVGRGSVELETVDGALALWFGVASRGIAGALAVAAVLGLHALQARSPRLVRMLVVGAGFQIVAMAVSRALGIEVPMIFGRYCLPVVPVLVLGLAVFLAQTCSRIAARSRPLATGVGTLAIAGLVALGPWWQTLWFPNQQTNHWMFQGDYATDRDPIEARLRPVAVSAAYSMLAALPPGSTTIVETPFPQDSTANPFALLQQHHRQRVVGGLAGDLVPGTLPALRGAGGRTPRWTAQVTDIAGLRERGVRFVLVHKRLREEFPNALFEHPTESGPIEAALRERLGAPAFEDTWITAFKLE